MARVLQTSNDGPDAERDEQRKAESEDQVFQRCSLGETTTTPIMPDNADRSLILQRLVAACHRYVAAVQ